MKISDAFEKVAPISIPPKKGFISKCAIGLVSCAAVTFVAPGSPAYAVSIQEDAASQIRRSVKAAAESKTHNQCIQATWKMEVKARNVAHAHQTPHGAEVAHWLRTVGGPLRLACDAQYNYKAPKSESKSKFSFSNFKNIITPLAVIFPTQVFGSYIGYKKCKDEPLMCIDIAIQAMEQ